MEHRRFIAFLDPFTGRDDTYEHNCFRAVYTEVMSLARAAGSDLEGSKYVFIYDTENNDLPVCAICNTYGIISVATTYNASVIRKPEVEA